MRAIFKFDNNYFVTSLIFVSLEGDDQLRRVALQLPGNLVNKDIIWQDSGWAG